MWLPLALPSTPIPVAIPVAIIAVPRAFRVPPPRAWGSWGTRRARGYHRAICGGIGEGLHPRFRKCVIETVLMSQELAPFAVLFYVGLISFRMPVWKRVEVHMELQGVFITRVNSRHFGMES